MAQKQWLVEPEPEKWYTETQVLKIYDVTASDLVIKCVKFGPRANVWVIPGRDGHTFYSTILLERHLGLQKRL